MWRVLLKEIKQTIDKQIKFEPGYYPTYGGTFENLQAANLRLGIRCSCCFIADLFLVVPHFSSVKQALLIFTAIPLSAIGGIIALWLRECLLAFLPGSVSLPYLA